MVVKKKKFSFFLNFLFFLPFVSALQYRQPAWGEVSTGIGNALNSFLNQLFNIDKGFIDPVLFSKLLIFILIFAVIYYILKEKLNWDTNITIIISIIASILGIRILPAEIVNLVMLPYGAMTIVLTTFLPIIIIYFFTTFIQNKWINNGVWILTCVSMFALAIIRYPYIGPYIWIYFASAIIVLIIWGVQAYLRSTAVSRGIKRAAAEIYEQKIIELKNEIDQLTERLATLEKKGAEKTSEERKEERKIEKKIKLKTKSMKALSKKQ